MADTVNTSVLVNDGDRYVVRLTNESDGTGESGVVKIDKSGLVDTHGLEPVAVDIERIRYHISGFNYVTLHWDHATDDVADVLPVGAAHVDYQGFGGDLDDPTLNDGTGDLILTTDGAIDGASYSILLYCKLRRSP